MTLEKQLALLSRMADRDGARWLSNLLWCAAAFLAIFTFSSLHIAYAFGALFMAALAYACQVTAGHIERAAKGLIAGPGRDVVVTVDVEEWSESVSYYAEVDNAAGQRWRFQFRPIGWTPVDGQTVATAYDLPETAWPVLLVLPDGIAYPCQAPTLVKTVAL